MKSHCLPGFHAFTGCNTTSSFSRKGKKRAWKAWLKFPEVNEAFLHMMNNPFSEMTCQDANFDLLEHLVVVMYDGTSGSYSVNETRRELFSRKDKSLDTLQPTQVSLTCTTSVPTIYALIVVI